MNPEILTSKLILFIDHLRRCGYHIGINQFTAAQDLILALAAQGQLPTQLSRLRTLLAPILCHSPKEQAEFQYHFDNWLNQLERLTPTPVQTNSAAAVISQNQTCQEKTALERALSQIKVVIPFWRSATVLFAVVLIISIINFFANNQDLPLKGEIHPPSPENQKQLSPSPNEPHEPITPPSPQNPGLERQFWFILLSPVLFFLLWQLWWQHRARLFLTRQSTTLAPDIKQLFVETIDDNLFQSMSLSHTAQQLRRHIPLAIQQLNITATIDKTIQAGGWFTPVMGTIPASPEYLVLVDRTTFKDHQTQLMNSLINRLIQQDVFITHYYFDADPRRCYPQSSTFAPLTLTELAERYPRHRLMIFSTSTGFINPITGQLVDWIEQLSIWSPRILLTLESPAQWGYQEQLLVNADFLVLPANETGLTRLAEQINTPRSPIHHPFDFSTPSVSFPELLSERPRRWLERHAPDSQVLTELLQQVQYFLGEKGYYWFSACAIYPELHWQLTLYLGYNLHLLTEECLAKLAHLPWFRYGYMPNWLRERLIADLSLAQEREIRMALQALLLTVLEKPLSNFHLEIAQPQKSIFSILAHQLLPKLIKRVSKKSPLRDYIFLTFMADKLSVKVPKLLNTFLANSGNYIYNFLKTIISFVKSYYYKPKFIRYFTVIITLVLIILLGGWIMWRDRAISMKFVIANPETLSAEPFLVCFKGQEVYYQRIAREGIVPIVPIESTLGWQIKIGEANSFDKLLDQWLGYQGYYVAYLMISEFSEPKVHKRADEKGKVMRILPGQEWAWSWKLNDQAEDNMLILLTQRQPFNLNEVRKLLDSSVPMNITKIADSINSKIPNGLYFTFRTIESKSQCTF